jgi:hypothetical protein
MTDYLKAMRDADEIARRSAAVDPYLRNDPAISQLTGLDTIRSHMASAVAGLRLDQLQASIAGLDLGHLQRVAADYELQRSAIRDQLLGWNDQIAGLGSELRRASEQAIMAQEALKLQFRMPALGELSALQAAVAGALPAFDRVLGAGFRAQMEAIKTPWLEINELQRSVSAFAELQNVGALANSLKPFAESVSAGLRNSLGNWTTISNLPDAIFIDPGVRSSFYGDLGFNADLTNFPYRAFDKSVEIAGLSIDEDEETGDAESPIERNVSAFIHLNKLETNIREFIDEVMTAAFGPTWFDRQMPNGMKEKWVEKRDKARANGEPDQPLINFADFTDYVLIIQKRDNWSRVFEVTFRRVEDIRESFYRLSPIRIVAMHSRIVTLDDELLLKVESRRVLKAIGKV